MRSVTEYITIILSVSLFSCSVYADAQMFRPFESYIDCEFDKRCACSDGGNSCKMFTGNYYGEKYRIIREKRSEYWNKQTYYKRHCGSAYINCCFPNEDYPRYNGPGYDLRSYQRKPYYPPFR